MNEEWVLTQLRRFVDLTRMIEEDGEYFVIDRPSGDPRDIVASAQVVEKILDRVVPRWRTQIPEDPSGQWIQHHEAALRAIAEIQTAAEVQQNLGDNSPFMAAGAMHPWVWEAARSLWQSMHYAEAVTAATIKVSAELQNKTGRRDIGETSLFQQSFSADAPVVGKPRLRPKGDDGGSTSLSTRRGIVALAEAVYAALRNPASHDVTVEISEQLGLERLATVSLLARWVDECDIVTA